MNVPPRFASVVAAAVLLPAATPAHGQSYDLVFDHPVQSVNAYHSQLGDYYRGPVLEFRDVAPRSGTAVDMRVTVSGVTAPRYAHEGLVPGYSGAAGEPAGDLGFLFAYKGGAGSGGDFGPGSVTYQLEFFAGGGGFTDPLAIPDFRLLLYDLDGEETQDESLVAFNADGLVSYQLFASSEMEVTWNGDGYHRFTGPGTTRDESDPRTAFVLRYRNTSSIRLQVIANTHPDSQHNNGVFGGIDGDLSMLRSGVLGQEVSVVPEPASAVLALGPLAALLLRRRRHGG